MAVHHKYNDELQKELRGVIADNRMGIWLWFFMINNHPQEPVGEIKSPGMRDRIANTIKNKPGLASHIEALSATRLIPERNLEWIKDEKRQNAFITKKLDQAAGFSYTQNPGKLTNRELSIAAIDCFPIDHMEKLLLVQHIKSEWELNSSTDHIFKWLDKGETVQKVQTAWEIINNKHQHLLNQHYQSREKDDLLIAFDSSTLTPSEKALLMDSIKKRWSQNKYRAKLIGKNQYNFILSDRAICRLDKLAKKHEIKRTEVLEILLKMEEENGDHILKHLNRLSDL